MGEALEDKVNVTMEAVRDVFGFQTKGSGRAVDRVHGRKVGFLTGHS